SDIDWESNNTSGAYTGTNYAVNTGNAYAHNVNITRHSSIPDYIDNATFNTIFNTERYDVSAAPEMEFNFNVDNADYMVNIFFSNTYNGIDGEGERIFDIAIEGNTVQSNLDLVAQYGHRVGVMLSFPVTVDDNVLNIEFLHSVIENPLLNAIEIRLIANEEPIEVELIATQNNNVNDIIDGTLNVVASGGDGNLVYTASGLPNGITLDSATGTFNGTIASDADTNSPYTVTVTVDDSDNYSNDVTTISFEWNIVNPDSFVPLYRINAGGPLITATDS
ncbi:hypothetical protein PW52_15975, partial [Tamlana sedimentorum]